MDLPSTEKDNVNQISAYNAKKEHDYQEDKTDLAQPSMELLYIWINEDETGFIRQQGFNFSPKYRFEMKTCEDGKYELSCEEKPDYPNVWNIGNIVNMTAVVGENGSGKSALLRHLANASFLRIGNEKRRRRAFEYMVQAYRYDGSTYVLYNLPKSDIRINGEYFLVHTSDNDYLKMQELLEKQSRIYITNAFSSPDSLWKYRKKHRPLFFSEAVNDARSLAFFQKITGYNRLDVFPRDFLLLQARIMSMLKYEDFERLVALSYDHRIANEDNQVAMISAQNKDIVVEVMHPWCWCHKNYRDIIDSIEYSASLGDGTEDEEELGQLEEERWAFSVWYKELISPLLGKYIEMTDHDSNTKEPLPIEVLFDALSIEILLLTDPEELSPENFKLLCKDPILFFKNHVCDMSERDENVLHYYESALDELKELENILHDCLIDASGCSNKNRAADLRMIIKYNSENYTRFGEYIDKLLKKERSFVLKYLLFVPMRLSSGEQALHNISTWLRLAPSYMEVVGEDPIPIQDNILLLLDEVDLYMHPEWQRKFLKYLSDELTAEYPNKHIQIIISTHSPLVLSDIPSGNIIYLEKNDDKCTIAQGPETKESFGANIYSLLKDSFFLKRSLGEFAHSKITEVIDALDRLKKNPEDSELRKTCEQHKRLIDIIGEPVIRRKLQLLYEDIFGKDPDADAERKLDSVQQLLKSDNPKYRELLKAMLSEVQSE